MDVLSRLDNALRGLRGPRAGDRAAEFEMLQKHMAEGTTPEV